MIFVEDVNSEVIFKHWLDLDRSVDRNGDSCGRECKEGIQGQESRVGLSTFWLAPQLEI